MTPRRIAQAAYFVEPWKNGLGATDVIAEARVANAPAQGWEGLVWRLARTPILSASPFSDLSGYDRYQVVIEGDGLYLDTETASIDLSRPLVPVRYSGDLKIVSRLENGPVRVLNLIVDRKLAEGRMTVLAGPATTELGEGRHLLVAASGAAIVECGDAAMTAGDGLTIDDGDTLEIAADSPVRIRIRSGSVVLSSIHARNPDSR
ncbi:MAG: HutD family protein [Lautropia sp.]